MQENGRDVFGLFYDTLGTNRPCGKTRLWRVYCELKLNFKRRGKKRLPDRISEPLLVPRGPNQTWSIDFMADALWNSRRFITFNVLDDFNREALRVEIDTSLPENVWSGPSPNWSNCGVNRNACGWTTGLSSSAVNSSHWRLNVASPCSSSRGASQPRTPTLSDSIGLTSRQCSTATCSTAWGKSGR